MPCGTDSLSAELWLRMTGGLTKCLTLLLALREENGDKVASGWGWQRVKLSAFMDGVFVCNLGDRVTQSHSSSCSFPRQMWWMLTHTQSIVHDERHVLKHPVSQHYLTTDRDISVCFMSVELMGQTLTLKQHGFIDGSTLVFPTALLKVKTDILQCFDTSQWFTYFLCSFAA